MQEKLLYPAVFLQEKHSITVTFPDLPGCISCAETFEEAYDMAKEAMELYLEDYLEDSLLLHHQNFTILKRKKMRRLP